MHPFFRIRCRKRADRNRVGVFEAIRQKVQRLQDGAGFRRPPDDPLAQEFHFVLCGNCARWRHETSTDLDGLVDVSVDLEPEIASRPRAWIDAGKIRAQRGDFNQVGVGIPCRQIQTTQRRVATVAAGAITVPEDRLHRIGQQNAVTYVDITSPKTIDEEVRKALRGKMVLSAKVLGEKAPKWL